MKKILAIRGAYQNGDEVIKILEMLGGVNSDNLKGDNYRHFYFIHPNTKVIESVFEEYMLITQWETHSLKSFYEEYPYKTFDKLVINGKDCSIVETFWSGFTIRYKVYNNIYLSEYSAERIKELVSEKPVEQKVVNTDKSNLQIFGEIYEGLEQLEKMGYSLDNTTCGELKKLLYKKIVG
jgi:hypothetical protein